MLESGSTTAAIALAFAGGFLLNLMPCVFPVLSLKILGFVSQARDDSARIRAHGWAFSAGVIVSFWILAATLLLLRAGGRHLGWGFQLQSPVFVALMAALILLLALSLAGVFEIGLSLSSVGASAQSKGGYSGSFFTGALATVVATPCTAPFMGPALGYALTQAPLASMATFTSLGAGMAAPYLALSYFPAALRRLPRPGAWMETFRQLLAFPLLATVWWLLHVFYLQTGADALFELMASLLLASFAAWMWGRYQSAGRRFALALTALCVGALALFLTVRTAADAQARRYRREAAFAASVEAGASMNGRATASTAVSAGAHMSSGDATETSGDTGEGLDATVEDSESVHTHTSAPAASGTQASAGTEKMLAGGDDFWTRWTPDLVTKLREQGRAVFINFTAAWCISCRVNERLVFSKDDVREEFRKYNVAALKADWTNQDETISRALESYGRDGVPLYVFYPAGSAKPRSTPLILPQMLTKQTLVDAFSQTGGDR